jgi:saccharopine dehydrogenase-like NADP-dependent oxidoreductase
MSHEKAYELCNSNATGYFVGTGGATGTELLIEGVFKKKGLYVPEQLPSEEFLGRLPAKHLDVKEEVKPL